MLKYRSDNRRAPEVFKMKTRPRDLHALLGLGVAQLNSVKMSAIFTLTMLPSGDHCGMKRKNTTSFASVTVRYNKAYGLVTLCNNYYVNQSKLGGCAKKVSNKSYKLCWHICE